MTRKGTYPSRLAERAAPASWPVLGAVCAYRARVIAGELWPNISWTTFTLTPLASIRDAAVCRVPCNGMSGRPEVSTRSRKRAPKWSGLYARPSSSAKT